MCLCKSRKFLLIDRPFQLRSRLNHPWSKTYLGVSYSIRVETKPKAECIMIRALFLVRLIVNITLVALACLHAIQSIRLPVAPGFLGFDVGCRSCVSWGAAIWNPRASSASIRTLPLASSPTTSAESSCGHHGGQRGAFVSPARRHGRV